MFTRRVYTFKLVLEYGRDSLAEQAPLVPGGQVRLTKALATLEFEFNSDENEAVVLERFTQAKSRITFDRLEERVMLKLLQRSDDALRPINVKLSIACMSPVLRTLQVVRTSATGSVPEALLTALLEHCDLSGVWKLRGAEGFGNFWCSCCEVRSWRALAHMNLSACGLTSLPPALGSLGSLRILRLSHNKLTALPVEVSALTALEVLVADHNLLTTVPAELRFCSSLRHLELEDNRLARPVLDLRPLSALMSLQLYGNPLEYLPELSPASALRSLSLANVRIRADAAYSRWEVEIAPLAYMSRSHKLAPLFQLTFRRSSCQHPLLAGALGRISEDRSNCELMAREETAIQQLVLMALSEQPVVAEQACRTLGALAGLGPATAKKLLGHDVQSTLVTLLRSPRRASKLCGLTLLGSMAAASEAVSAELLTAELLALLQSVIQADDTDPRVAALTALAHLAFCRENKLKIHDAPGLLTTLKELAGATASAAYGPEAAGASGALPSRASPTAAAAAVRAATSLAEPRPDGATHALPPLPQLPPHLSSQSERVSPPKPGPEAASPSAAAVDAAPAVVRMPSRSLTAGGGGAGGGGGGGGQRHSDTGSGGSPLAAFWFGSPPGPSGSSMSYGGGYGSAPSNAQASTAPGSLSVGGGAAASAAAVGAPPRRTSQGSLGPTATPDPLSPPQQQQQQQRPLHHSASTPATVGLATTPTPTAAAPPAPAPARPLTPVQPSSGGGVASAGGGGGGPLSPASPTPADAAAATASGLPPQIALAPPRAVPEPVSRQEPVRLLAIKALAILGENECVRRAVGQPPLAGRGVRVLALDGGGMRGLALVQMMRHIERRTGRPLHALFDLVVGTSTGAIVAFGLGVFHFSLDQCEAIYTGLGHKVFNQAGASASGASPREELLAAAQAQAAQAAAAAQQAAAGVVAAAAAASSSGASSGWRDSLFRVVRGTSTNLRVAVYGFKHDASTFEELLRAMCDVKKLGCVGNQLIDAAALGAPKVAAVATQVSCCPVTPFLFTSYELPPRAAADAAAMRAVPSSSRHLIWQAVRASSAAPYYLDDFVCGDDRYQDGAATANNPAILALQQARLLWPGARLDALVSLGCGAAPPVRRERGAHAVLDTGAVLVDAATSPDRADEALATLLPLVPGARYFRFQPVHERCSMELDDVNPQHWAGLQAAVDEYCTAHSARFDELAELLLSGREAEEAAAAVGGTGAGGGGGGVEGGSGEVEAEAEEPFEVPPGVGPDGGPLPPVPRVRLGTRHGIVVVEAASPAAAPHAGAATGGSGGPGGSGGSGGPGGSGGSGPRQQPHALLSAEQAVVEALAQRPQTLRRCDLAATAADAALSASLAEAHMRRLEERQREAAAAAAAAAAPPPTQEQLAGPLAGLGGGGGSGELLDAPVAAAVAAAAAAGAEPRPTAQSVGGGLLSPTRLGPSLQVRAGARHWTSGNSGRSVASVGGWALPAGGAAGGPMAVAGELVAAEAEAAAAAAAETTGVVATARVLEPTATEPAAVGTVVTGQLSVADAAAEAAAAGEIAAASEAAAAAAGSAAASTSGGSAAASAAASTSTSAAATATSLLYDFLFVKRGSSARGMSVGGSSSANAAAAGSAAPKPAPPAIAVGVEASADAATGDPAPPLTAPPPLTVRTEGGSFSARPRPVAGVPGDASQPMASDAQPAGPGPGQDLPSPGARSGAGLRVALPLPSPAAAGPAGGAGEHDGSVTAGAGAAAVAASRREVHPGVLLAALLQDLQGRCGLLHLGLTAVAGGRDVVDGREEECGLVAGWRQDVVAVVEPGPDADRILAELGYSGGGGGGSGGGSGPRPSLASLFAATRGSALESRRCCSYRLLARQEVWHSGCPLSTLLLQVTRPSALLRPSDLAAMAAQLDGLVVTAAAPLPPPITAALLRAGAAAVICPEAPLVPPPSAARAAPLPSASPSSPPPPPPQQQDAVAASSVAAAASTGGAVLPYLVLPYNAAQRPSQQAQARQQGRSLQQSPVRLGAAAVMDGSGVRAEASAGGEPRGDGAAAVVRYFEALVGEMVAGATVVGAIAAADEQQAALRGRVTFHHL